jgi:hypothetical protein
MALPELYVRVELPFRFKMQGAKLAAITVRRESGSGSDPSRKPPRLSNDLPGRGPARPQ